MSSFEWMPDLAAALDELVPVGDSSRADWQDVVARVDKRRLLQQRGRRRPHWSLRLAVVVALLFLLLAGVATATYLLVRSNGDIALGGDVGKLLVVDPNGPGLHAVAGCAAWHPGEGQCLVEQPAWSPDGTRVAFVRGRYGGMPLHFSLYVAAADGTGVRRLALCGECGQFTVGQHLGWSPDGKWIAFSRDNGRQESLWVTAATGGTPRRLTECLAACRGDYKPGWSPDGRQLVFERLGTTAKPGGIYTIRADGSGLRLIAKGGQDPVWSPDGHRVAFDDSSGIEVVNRDGSHLRPLTPGRWRRGEIPPRDPAWSPDGRRLVYFATPGPGPQESFRAEVWTMNGDGSGRERLYRSGWRLIYWAPPIWSPDGRMIAFSVANDPAAGGTFVINADGTGLRRLSSFAFTEELSWQTRPKG